MDWDRVGWAPRLRACRLRSRTSSALSSHLTTTSCALPSTAEPEGKGGEAAGAGAQATPRTLSVWPFSRRTSAPVLASHTRAVLSSDAVASLLPSGLHATTDTQPVWPCSRRTSAPVLASHTRAVLS